VKDLYRNTPLIVVMRYTMEKPQLNMAKDIVDIAGSSVHMPTDSPIIKVNLGATSGANKRILGWPKLN